MDISVDRVAAALKDEVPSQLIGKTVPRFELSAAKGIPQGLDNRDLVGQVSRVHIFASWCIAYNPRPVTWE